MVIILPIVDCPQVQAVHNYHSAQPDELTLHEGDIVKVLRKLPDGEYRTAFYLNCESL